MYKRHGYGMEGIALGLDDRSLVSSSWDAACARFLFQDVRITLYKPGSFITYAVPKAGI